MKEPLVIPEGSTDGLIAELARTHARFRKAVRMCDVLDGEGITYEQTARMDERAWDVVTRAARLESSSVVTRMLAMELLRDRQERKMRG